jgi:hypothetical protein
MKEKKKGSNCSSNSEFRKILVRQMEEKEEKMKTNKQKKT